MSTDPTPHAIATLAWRGIKEGLPRGTISALEVVEEGKLIVELASGRRLGVTVTELDRRTSIGLGGVSVGPWEDTGPATSEPKDVQEAEDKGGA